MFGHATIPFFILFVALTNLYLGYATAVFLGWGPAARRSAKAAPVAPPPPLANAPPTAPTPAVVSTAAEPTVAAPSPPSPEATTLAVADGGGSPDTDELAPDLLAAIQSAIDQEP